MLNSGVGAKHQPSGLILNTFGFVKAIQHQNMGTIMSHYGILCNTTFINNINILTFKVPSSN